MKHVVLISSEEWEHVCNKDGEDMEQFELISPDAEYIMIRDNRTPIEQDLSKYKILGIQSRKDDNPRNLISFDDILRYLNDTKPDVLRAAEAEIRQLIPGDIRKLMTIEEFHFSSTYAVGHNPRQEELYQLIANILVTKDLSHWKPTLPANNHWSNWESGHL